MAISTARDLITASLRLSSVIGEIATPTAEQADTGINELNGLLSDWNNESLIPFKHDLLSFTTSGGQQDYTIGTSSAANVSASSPTKIDSVSLLQDSTTTYPLTFVSYIDFQENPRDLNTQTLPAIFTYNRTYPDGTLSLYPIPDTGYTLKVVYSTSMGNYGLDDTLSLPDGYTGAIQYGLSDILCTVYGIENPRIRQLAVQRKATIERNNFQGNLLDTSRRLKYSIQGDRYV